MNITETERGMASDLRDAGWVVTPPDQSRLCLVLGPDHGGMSRHQCSIEWRHLGDHMQVFDGDVQARWPQ